MTTNIRNLPVATQRTSPAGCSAAIDHLSACLAMVRPAWMSDEAAAEWTAVAAADIAHLSPTTLAIAAREARATCTHHGQILPAILNSSAVAEQRKYDALRWADRDQAWDNRKAQIAAGPAQKLIASAANARRVP